MPSLRRGRLARTAALLTAAGALAAMSLGGPGVRLAAVQSSPSGELHVVGGRGPVIGHGPLRRYRVAVERGLHVDRHRFVVIVRETLGDRRGWGRDLSFRRVSTGDVAFTVALASPDLTDQLCAPLQTNGIYSCFNNGRAVINNYRWTQGAASYGWERHLPLYRRYVILHEIGHGLGHGHVYDCRADGLAPTMMQQTKSLYGCRRNAWPYPGAVSSRPPTSAARPPARR